MLPPYCLNLFSEHHQRLYPHNDVGKIRLLFWLSSQYRSNIIVNVISKKFSRICFEKRETRFFLQCTSQLLAFLGHFECDENLLWLSYSWMSMFMASTISIMDGIDSVPDSEFLENLKISCQKTWNSLLFHFGTLTGRMLPTMQSAIAPPDSVAQAKKILELLSVSSLNKCTDALEATSIVELSVVKLLWSTVLWWKLPRIISPLSSSIVYHGGVLKAIATISKDFCINCGL